MIKTITVDDFDGTTEATTNTFALNGDFYSIDLSAENLGALEEALAPFIEKANLLTDTDSFRDLEQDFEQWVDGKRVLRSPTEGEEEDVDLIPPTPIKAAPAPVKKAAKRTARKKAATKRRKPRPVSKTTGRPSGGQRNPEGSASESEIRAWAQDNNVPVTPTGRVARSTREAYERAHQDVA